MTRAEANRIRAIIETAVQSLPDREASEAPMLFADLKGDGSLIRAGTRIRVGNRVLRASVDLWDRADSTPEAAPTLWAELPYVNGIRRIPDTITVTEAFSKGEKGIDADGVIWESLTDSNVYTPVQYAPNWRKVSQ